MSPEVTAAIIAASVGVLTLIGTLAAQYFGRRATSRDTQKALDEQREQLNKTLAEQRKQLERTLAEQRTRTLNERFRAAEFADGTVDFDHAKFSGGTVNFRGAGFHGAIVDFGDAEFAGGTVGFSIPRDWSVPPAFPWPDTPPPGVTFGINSPDGP